MPRVGRDRTRHTRLPTGWAPSKSGVIYFRPTNAADRAIVKSITGGPMSIRLGLRDEAHDNPLWLRIVAARRIEADTVPGSVAELCERARLDYLPMIANEETRAWRERHVDELERAFGARRYARNVYDATKAAPGAYLVAMDVQRHIDAHRKTRPVAVNRAAQTWKIVFDEARRRWGLTEYNPCAGLAKNTESSRETLPDDRAHFFKVYRHLDPSARFVLALGRYYGRRRGEALKIQLSGVQDDGLHTVRGKRARELILQWDDRLRKMVARVMRWRESVIRPTKVWKNGKRPAAPSVVSTALLINRRGRKLTPSGYNTAFTRAMERAGLTEVLGEEVRPDGSTRRRTRRAFVTNDTRAKRASTLRRGHATEVLAHDEQRTTESVYRRGPLRIVVDESPLADSRTISEISEKRSGIGRK